MRRCRVGDRQPVGVKKQPLYHLLKRRVVDVNDLPALAVRFAEKTGQTIFREPAAHQLVLSAFSWR
jgi:hypothetical protein